jgi:glycosyltransferase involved in cell wall biosynthesis
MGLTFIVATFGDPAWLTLANDRAIPSVAGQGFPVLIEHGETLAGARNRAAERAETEWLVFLDADDTVNAGYGDAILGGTGDLRPPALFEGDTEVHLDLRDMEWLNRCPIGTGIRREVFLDCGGFPDFDAWEDWALFLRAYRRGAVIGEAPGAVYRATVRPDSRNRTVRDGVLLHRRIRAWA